jgi:hypothetical protein
MFGRDQPSALQELSVGIRETLNQNPAITTVATIIIILATLGLIVYQTWDFGGPSYAPPTQAWFTVDDGKTWFADDISKLPPWDYQGRPAHRVFVYTCDDRTTTFAAYLMRYTPEAKQKLTQGNTSDPMMQQLLNGPGVEVKPPLTGEKGWLKRSDPAAAALLQPLCKQTNAPAVVVEP